jgi:hypothetical protein
VDLVRPWQNPGELGLSEWQTLPLGEKRLLFWEKAFKNQEKPVFKARPVVLCN